ncbi:FtsX-like permease family protein [Streptomyces sp. NPDC048603]|uniref:ABC transporter permease n=1 Tax=Streptomyces sp. NPDC048603 TaxID=3365577 RepID=UPI003722B0CC
MSAVWRASRAAVRRRRLQTSLIGLLVLFSTTAVLLALSVLDAASGPFERAYDEQRGAHSVATFDRAQAPADRLAGTALHPGVEAASGPFDQAVLQMPQDWLWNPPGPLTVVGRADPARDAVDRVQLLAGRWATAPGEIVVDWPIAGTPDLELLGTRLQAIGAPPLTVVGFATSMSQSAGAWVAPGQIAGLNPTATQMLYRFDTAADTGQVGRALARATADLPEGALLTAQPWTALRASYSANADAYLPFMSLFSVLGLLVSVLIVGNVVSGAVVSGYRHIGILKALGYTPGQVVAVYLTMVSVPAVAGSVLGTLLGSLLAEPFLTMAFSGIETGNAVVSPARWVPALCLLGMPALVALAALVPALRAHRVPAARALTAGSAPRTGRGLRVQRFLAGTRLPRPVSLGLGQPFVRPARTLLTLSAIALGITTVTLATGLTSTLLGFGKLDREANGGGPRISVRAGGHENNGVVPTLTDEQIEARLRALPGAEQVLARAHVQVRMTGHSRPVFADFYRGDTQAQQVSVLSGRLPQAPGEVIAGPGFLAQRGLAPGDPVSLELNGHRVSGRITGELTDGDPRALTASWASLGLLAPETRAVSYAVRLADGADPHAYAEAVRALGPGLSATVSENDSRVGATVIGFSSAFTLLVGVVTALGVFNTVLLNARERRRDLGMLKSIGMTPRQVVLMTVTSVAGIGAVGGLVGIPFGIAAHRLVVDHVGVISFPESLKNVWHAPQLTGLVLAGVLIAVLGALIPARSAARLAISEVLHNE